MGKSQVSEDTRKEKPSLLYPLVWPVDVLPLLDKGLFFLNLSLRHQWMAAPVTAEPLRAESLRVTDPAPQG